MEAKDILLRPLLEVTRQFIIPVFQRDYSWDEIRCDQLWRDVKRVGGNAALNVHFIGSVVYIAAENSSADVPRWLLIDGQQRLTTITLMLVALRDRMRTERKEGWPSAEQLENQYLLNQYATGDLRHKLQLRRRDDATLKWLIDRRDAADGKPAEVSKRILENYEDFKRRLDSEDPKVIYDGLLKLKLVHVILHRGQDDPQMIFESMNSTGMDLTPGDLVRNYVLMRQEEAEQTRLYTERWQPIEQCFGSQYRERFDTFLNHYLVIRTRQNKPVKAVEVYPQFKIYFEGVRATRGLDDELADMGSYARYYVRCALGQEPDVRLKAAFARLTDLVVVAAPVVMQLYAFYEEGRMDANSFLTAVGLLESYVFRRSICDMQTRGLGNIMSTLVHKLRAEDPLGSLKVSLKMRGEAQRFPDDDEFRLALETRDLYHTDNCAILLDRLENHDTRERVSTKDYTIEHVMPQNEALHKEWQEMLGADWKTVQKTWLHRLGNLTLTGYNSTYSDRPFKDKKTIDHGFNVSPLRLNQYIKAQPVWTATEMEARGKEWAKKALKEWPPLVVATEDVQRARLAELQERSSRYTLDTLDISEETAGLFQEVRTAMLGLGPDIVEVFHSKSVTYRGLEYVVEVLPGARHLVLLFNLDYAACDDPSGNAQNMEERAFVVNAQESGGVLLRIDDIDQVAAAVHIARQSYAGINSRA